MRKRAKFLAGSWLVAVLVLAGLLVVTGPAAAQGDDPAPTPFWEANEDPALNAEMDHVEQATSILRDLPAIEPVTRAFITRDELLAYLMTVLDEDYPPEAARDDVIFYHAFDFMDLDVDLRLTCPHGIADSRQHVSYRVTQTHSQYPASSGVCAVAVFPCPTNWPS